MESSWQGLWTNDRSLIESQRVLAGLCGVGTAGPKGCYVESVRIFYVYVMCYSVMKNKLSKQNYTISTH